MLKGVTQAIENETKKQREGFHSMLSGTPGASFLGNISAGKGLNRAGDGVHRAGQDFKATLSSASSDVSFCLLTVVIGTTVEIVSDNISLVFLVNNWTFKMFFKTIATKKINTHR